ncbi:hypothetical protein H4R34_001670 [Dimargaris verticillata]|uniref:Uncharacterized protein n=1 Tax=Dimargaris verticillata TaxID=2761393 RepID=A0A9W8BAY1_9FUNG|nr:hypothetical protein H4R34_001670 [Dimargaris verticillata]
MAMVAALEGKTHTTPLSQDNVDRHLKTWVEVKAILAAQDYDKLTRTLAVEQAYAKAKRLYQESHGGTAQFVAQHRLHWDLNQVQSQADAPFDPQETCILPNDFPYALEADIRHLVLWSKRPLRMDDQVVHQHLVLRYPGHEIMFFIHSPTLQSVPALPHGHVFVYKRP